MINSSFQSNQGYMDNKFDELKGEIKGVDNRLVNVEKKLDGFIDTDSEEKLPMRMEYVENTLNLPKK